jgi:hypothetical protein
MKQALLAMAMLSMAGAHAQDVLVAQSWQALAAADSAAALKLIEENHPGAAPELGDKQFLDMLARARTHVAERLPKVSTFGGYNALMNGMAADFEDGHIRSSARAGWLVRNWAGIIPVRRGGKWMVGLHEAAAGEPDVSDAQIIDCDGEPFDSWAARRISQFAGNARIEAELARRAASLLLDDANPFVSRAVACSFLTKAGATRRLTLAWRPVLYTTVVEKAAKAQPRALARTGVSAFDGGYWIGIPNLGPDAAEVVKAVQDQQAALRSAPLVVIDLRGNGGGNSSYAYDIAALLQGEARAGALAGAGSACTGLYWRASPGNLADVREAHERASKRGDKEYAEYTTGVADAMAKALAEHRNFAPSLPACAAGSSQARDAPVPASVSSQMKGKLVLITDRSCFSSCLIAADYFRRLGALHVGEATDVSTRYMEVRDVMMPSGIRTFSTLAKVNLGAGDYGPYVPEVPYPGDLADEKALKDWVGLLGKR